MEDNLKDLVKEFFAILDVVEESDSGKEFHPVVIHSCRVLLTKKLNEIIPKIKELIEE